MFTLLTTVQMEPIFAFPCQHLTVLYCWRLNVGPQQYK